MLEQTKRTTSEILERYPNLPNLKGGRFLVKYGGAAMEREEVRDSVCSEIAALSQFGINIVVVHGGGKEISRLIERLGLESHFIEGLRVTQPEVMEATEMVLSGKVNKDLVSRIEQSGARAAGISGRDGRILEAVKIKGRNGDCLGNTGEVQHANTHLIEVLTQGGYVPVVSPVGQTAEGDPLNLNADYAAAALAGGLKVDLCLFLTDVAGVKRNGEVLPELSAEAIEQFIADGTISGGMIPKVQCALRALAAGCAKAAICDAARPFIVSAAICGDRDAGTTIHE